MISGGGAPSFNYLFFSWIIFSSSEIFLLASSNKYFTSAIDRSLFYLALFFIYFALLPNFRVPTVSSLLSIAGLQVIMRLVFELPPRDS